MAGGPFNLIICMNRERAVVDIDGTLCVVGDRRKYMEQNDPDWESFYRDDFNDLPIRTVCDFVRQMSRHYDIFFCTSRRETVRQKTQIWLQQNLLLSPKDYTLIMRPNSDNRPDVVSKIDSFTQETTEYERSHVGFVLEDSLAMAHRWRELGYRCFHVQ